VFAITYAQLRELTKYNISVHLLNELEKNVVKEVKAVKLPDLEIARGVLEKLSKMTKIIVKLHRGRICIIIIPHDKSKLEEIASMLEACGIRFSINRRDKRIEIYAQKSVEVFRKIMPHLFRVSSFCKNLVVYM